MKIAIGCDHGALALKESVKKVLAELGAEINDLGTFTEESVDYPDIAEKVCAEVTSGRAERGVVLCGTGIGISIAANKISILFLLDITAFSIAIFSLFFIF